MSKRNNAVIYCRSAVAERATTNSGLSGQEKECKRLAKSKALEVVKVFIDNGASGNTLDRDQFKKMLALCRVKRNNITTIICTDANRISRNYSDYISIEKFASKHKINLLFVGGYNNGK